MDHADQIDVSERLPNGRTYRLPYRDAAVLRVPALACLGIGAVGTIFMLLWMSGPFLSAFEGEDGVELAPLLFAALGLFGLVPTLGLLTVGLGLFCGRSRCEITVDEERLVLRERIGPLSKRWQRARASIRAIQVGDVGDRRSLANPGQTPGLPGNLRLDALHLITSGDSLYLAIGYPTAIVAELADRLGQDWHWPVETAAPAPSLETLEAAAASDALPATEPEQPPGCRLAYEVHPRGVAVMIPRRGLIRGSHGFFLFALAWTLFSLGMMVTVLSQRDTEWQGLLLLGLFVAIGLAMLAISIQLGLRQAALLITDGELAMRWTGPLRTSTTTVSLAEIAAVRIGPSGVEVNDSPVMEVQIIGIDEQKRIGCCGQWRDEDKAWLSAFLTWAIARQR